MQYYSYLYSIRLEIYFHMDEAGQGAEKYRDIIRILTSKIWNMIWKYPEAMGTIKNEVHNMNLRYRSITIPITTHLIHGQKRFYTRGTLRSIRITRLVTITTLYRDWLRFFK